MLSRLEGLRTLPHRIVYVADFDAIALNTATHFAFRPECMACPVVQLCKGSCMFLEGDFFAQSCANEFAFNFGIMLASVWHLTGMVVVGVEAAVGRPRNRSELVDRLRDGVF